MSEMNEKAEALRIAATNENGGPLLIGTPIIGIKDESTETFATGSVKDFVRYIQQDKSLIGEEVNVFVDPSRRSAVVKRIKGSPRNKGSVAELAVQLDPYFQKLLHVKDEAMPSREFEKLLRFMGTKCIGGMDLAHQVRNMSITKVTNIKQQKHPNGDYTYLVSREGNKGDQSFEPPQTLAFVVNPFEDCKKEVKLTFELHFDFVESNGAVAISFELINPELEYITRKLFIDAISEELEGVDVPVFSGNLRTNIADDSWSYREGATPFPSC